MNAITTEPDLFAWTQRIECTPMPTATHKAWIVDGDADDPHQTLVVDGTRTEAAAGGAR
jgi:hypothetical protein